MKLSSFECTLRSVMAALLAAAIAPAAVCAETKEGIAETEEGAPKVYTEQCATCHGTKRYGGYAPPLIPQSISRKSDEELVRTILDGRPNTQMEGFAQKIGLKESDAQALVALIREPVGEIQWGMEEIAQSRVEVPIEEPKISPEINRKNIILVVSRGTDEISVLDGDTLMQMDRFPVPSIHGGPKFDLPLENIFAATRDGTVVAYDLARGGLRTKVKVAVNTRNVAISPDAQFVAVANQLPAQLVLMNGQLEPLALFPLDGQPSGVYQLPGEQRFVLTLRDNPKLLTVDYPEMTLREVALPEPFEDFIFVPGRREILASSRGGKRIMLYDFDAAEVRATIETEALPHLFSACFFTRGGKRYAALNHIGAAKLSIIDLESFQLEKEIPLVGSGFFARTHEGTPYIWVDTNSEQIQLIDKATLTLREEPLVPEAGKISMHVEFTADGSQALVSVWNPAGWVVIYDSKTLEERIRLPYDMPIGKYNAYNKTRFMR